MNAKIGMQIICTAKQTVKKYRTSKSLIIRLGVSTIKFF